MKNKVIIFGAILIFVLIIGGYIYGKKIRAYKLEALQLNQEIQKLNDSDIFTAKLDKKTLNIKILLSNFDFDLMKIIEPDDYAGIMNSFSTLSDKMCTYNKVNDIEVNTTDNILIYSYNC